MQNSKSIKEAAMILLGGVLVMMVASSCGTETTEPNVSIDSPAGVAWPAEGDCNWYDLGQAGPCNKWGEFCTYGGQHCTTVFACGQVYPMGCVKP